MLGSTQRWSMVELALVRNVGQWWGYRWFATLVDDGATVGTQRWSMVGLAVAMQRWSMVGFTVAMQRWQQVG